MSTRDDSDLTGSTTMYERSTDESPTEAVIATVTQATGRSPLEMQPLAAVIDPDALNTLFGERDERPTPTSVSFEYCGRDVTVTADDVQVVRSESSGE